MLLAARPTELMLLTVGTPAEPNSSALTALEPAYAWSVLTTWIEAKPWPRLTLVGTVTFNCVALLAPGTSGPALTAPCEVATKKLTTEPGVKPEPLITNPVPTITYEVFDPLGGSDRKLITGPKGATVGTAVGVCVGAAEAVGVGVGVGVGTGLSYSRTRLLPASG